jgi:cation transport regulator
MPYTTNEQLPQSVRAHLPPRAQDIFREAFNHAFARHHGDDAAAFRIAWAAVKKQYKKMAGHWMPRW